MNRFMKSDAKIAVASGNTNNTSMRETTRSQAQNKNSILKP